MLDGLEDAVPGVEAVVDLVGEGRAVGGCAPVQVLTKCDFVLKRTDSQNQYIEDFNHIMSD